VRLGPALTATRRRVFKPKSKSCTIVWLKHAAFVHWSLDIRHRQILDSVPGPAPWYWDGYPDLTGTSGRKYTWRHHGDEGPVGYLITLAQRQEPDVPRLALNTYCHPFLLPCPGSVPHGDGASWLGIWCPEPGYIRLLCFDPDALAPFPLTDVAGWFKQSTERVYSATEPIAELEISSRLGSGSHSVEVPPEFQTLSELLLISTHPAPTRDDAASAILVLRPREQVVHVLPQRWFTASRYDVGRQWITRVARDPLTGRILGEAFRVGTFELTEDATDVARWLE
jgi:hypothetical protein